MPSLRDLRANRPVVTSAYERGLRIGMEQAAQDEISDFRDLQMQQLQQSIQQRTRRPMTPAVAQALGDLANPDLDLTSSRGKNAMSMVYGFSPEAFMDAFQTRNNIVQAARSTQKDIQDELATRDVIAGMFAASGIDVSAQEVADLEAAGLTRQEVAQSISRRERGERASQKTVLEERKLALKRQDAEFERLKFEHRREMDEVSSKRVQAQIAEIQRRVRQEGYDNFGEFSKDIVPHFLTILTNGRVERRRKDVPESRVAESAAAYAWELILRGMPESQAILQTKRDLDIRPTERRDILGGRFSTERTDAPVDVFPGDTGRQGPPPPPPTDTNGQNIPVKVPPEAKEAAKKLVDEGKATTLSRLKQLLFNLGFDLTDEQLEALNEEL